MRIHLVLAHPETASTAHHLAHRAQDFLAQAGQQVSLSDLHRSGFDPVAGPHDFLHSPQSPFSYQREQQQAVRENSFAPALAEEMRQVADADALLFFFPLWWLSVPAILKGWFDKILAFDWAYGGDKGILAKGPWRHKRAMLCFSTGAPELAFGEGARMGDLKRILHPIQYGTLFFCGMQVLPPFPVYAAKSLSPEELEQQCQVLEHKLNLLAKTPPLYH